MLTDTIRVAGVVPLVGLTESQLPPLVVLAAAVKGSGALELAMVSVCEAGWEPAC